MNNKKLDQEVIEIVTENVKLRSRLNSARATIITLSLILSLLIILRLLNQ